MSMNLSELKEGLAKIKDLETRLESSKWNQNSSPKAVSEFQASLLERYQQAKALYLQRRMEKILVDHINTYDPETNEFELPEVPEEAVNKDLNGGLDAQHAELLASLETSVHSVHAKLGNMRNKYQAVRSRRQELEKMVQDLEEKEGNGDTMELELDTTGDAPQDEEIAAEQQKIEELQEKKRELQAKLDSMRKEKEERLKSVSQYRGEIALLREEQEQHNLAGKDPEEFRKKIQELQEIKEFYDSLREVMEELGGVKIEHVKEDKDNQHLHLTVLLYEHYKVDIEMEVYRKTFLKVVNAKWATDPVVTSHGMMNDDGMEEFSIAMNPLDDLVQVAKTSMGPPHDVRFIIREACARIRITRDRVEDLAVLRRMVLTKVVGNDQVACSLNEGIVIVMRLYDQWVRVEQIVGVNGWDEATTKKLHSLVPDKDESMKPSLVVEIIQKEIRRMQKEDGFVVPKTPVLPKRKEENDEDMEY